MWSLKLSKESFKFSGAHFTTFSAEEAERLHGHNYYVSVNLKGCSKLTNGMIVDLNDPKKPIKKLLDELDEKVLIAENNPFLKLNLSKQKVELIYNKKHYEFPTEDCSVLPLENITIESLAFYVAQSLKETFSKYPIQAFSIEVAETRGQSCLYEVSL